MLTIAVPLAGNSSFFPEEAFKYPKVFQEICGRPMIQHVVENLMTIKKPKRFVFVVNDADAHRFRLDYVLRILTDNNCEIVKQHGKTKGAVCSLLLAVKHLNVKTPLLVANADQIIHHNLDELVSGFESQGVDGGLVCFRSVHPQWSYTRVSSDGDVMETAEKAPISQNAIAGMYYFSSGCDFVEAAKTTILKDRCFDGRYYTSMVMNELVLAGRRLRVQMIEPHEYTSFYSPERIKDFEQNLHRK